MHDFQSPQDDLELRIALFESGTQHQARESCPIHFISVFGFLIFRVRRCCRTRLLSCSSFRFRSSVRESAILRCILFHGMRLPFWSAGFRSAFSPGKLTPTQPNPNPTPYPPFSPPLCPP